MKVSDTKVNARSGLTFTALSFGGAPIGNFNGAFTEDEAQHMLDDPLILKKAADERGLKISSLSSHAPLAKPDVAVEYLRQSIRYAVEVGAPMIMTVVDGSRTATPLCWGRSSGYGPPLARN